MISGPEDVATGGSVVADAKVASEQALQINSDRQVKLKAHLEALRAELANVNCLLNQVEPVSEFELPEDEPPEQDEATFCVSGSFKPVGILTTSQIIQIDSPFWQDSQRREQYIDNTVVTSFSVKEKDALRNQVVLENKRIWTLQQPNDLTLLMASEMSDEAFAANLDGLDWSRIAAAVSIELGAKRTARTCEIRWLNELRPGMDTAPWSQQDDDTLQNLLEGGDTAKVDWTDMARSVGGSRKPIDCLRRSLPVAGHAWLNEDEGQLLNAVNRYGDNNWTLVALALKVDVTPTQCATRYQQITDKPAYNIGPWSSTEDDLLRRAVDSFGTSNFTIISRLVGSRSRHQCRERWTAQLDPMLDCGPWTAQQDEKLLAAVDSCQKQGETISWANISSILEHKRTDFSCRRRYELHGKGNIVTPLAKATSFCTEHQIPSGDAGEINKSSADKDIQSTLKTPLLDIPCIADPEQLASQVASGNIVMRTHDVSVAEGDSGSMLGQDLVNVAAYGNIPGKHGIIATGAGLTMRQGETAHHIDVGGRGTRQSSRLRDLQRRAALSKANSGR